VLTALVTRLRGSSGRSPTGRRDRRRDAIVRNNAATRWFHAATFVATFVLLFTGWWLRAGREGRPSVLADVLDTPDTEVHRTAGWALAGIAAAGLTVGVRAASTFARETVRIDRGDARWLRRWPVGALTGRFARHVGHFDPGQRLANLAFVATLGTLLGTGVALTTLTGGPTYATMLRVHRGATYGLTALVVGHLVVVSGVLPGYRGVWRAMLGRGRVPAELARRLWPSSAAAAGADDRHRSDPEPG
jgi:cytochrome b subunit of formate dehydrogenase